MHLTKQSLDNIHFLAKKHTTAYEYEYEELAGLVCQLNSKDSLGELFYLDRVAFLCFFYVSRSIFGMQLFPGE